MSPTQLNWLSIGMMAVLAAAALYVIYPVNKSTKLGLDLQGGIHVVLRAVDTPKAEVTAEAMDQAETVIRQRVDKLGVAEPQIERQGDRNFLVQLPGIKDPDEALEIIGQTALLEFAIVKDEFTELPDTSLNSLKREGQEVTGETQLTGDALTDAFVSFDQTSGAAIVNFKMNREGGQKFGEITKANVNKRLAIILDDDIVSAPTIRSAITGGEGIIEGIDSVDEAKKVSLVLQTGALPVELVIDQNQTVGPTLGRESLDQGVQAALLGLALVGVYLLIVYRVYAILAWIALAVFGALLWGLMVLIGVTLTLPGIAGAILMIGIAADSSIIIYERIKDEIRSGKTMRTALDTGFNHGFQTFLDADLVSFVTAVILFYFGVGTVKGFALVLMLGIICDLFTAFFFKRAALSLMGKVPFFRQPWTIGMRQRRPVEEAA